MAFPSQEQMIDDIKSEIILDVTSLVTTIAAAWPLVKAARMPNNDDELEGCLFVAQAEDLTQPVLTNGDVLIIRRVYVVDPQLFAQLSLRTEDAHRLDQNFGGLPLWATTRTEEQVTALLPELVRQRQEEIWQDAIKRARQRFHFTDHTDRRVPNFGRVSPWATEADADIIRENSNHGG
jgi:hypothetical protein